MTCRWSKVGREGWRRQQRLGDDVQKKSVRFWNLIRKEGEEYDMYMKGWFMKGWLLMETTVKGEG